MKPTAELDTRRFAVVFTVATDATYIQGAVIERHATSKLLCQLNGSITSLLGAGWHGDIVCLTSGLPTRVVDRLRQQTCSSVLSVSVPDFDAGPEAHNMTHFRDWMMRHQRVPPPVKSKVQFHWRRAGALTAVKVVLDSILPGNLIHYRSSLARLAVPRLDADAV